MGERARSIGSEAEVKAWRFLDNLGYKAIERNEEEYDIDCLALFPQSISKYELIKPRYAPNGLTAFEVTEESLRKTKVTDFKGKIERYNNDHADERIEGGILLVDQKISLKVMKLMREREIWGWGSNRQRLYKEKWGTYHAWKETLGLTAEIALDDTCSFLLCSTPPPTNSDKLLHFAIFFDNDFSKLSMRKVEEILNRIKENSISLLLQIGILPVNIHLEFHSVGGISITEEDFAEHVIKYWKTEGINIITTKKIFSDYRTFPSPASSSIVAPYFLQFNHQNLNAEIVCGEELRYSDQFAEKIIYATSLWGSSSSNNFSLGHRFVNYPFCLGYGVNQTNLMISEQTSELRFYS